VTAQRTTAAKSGWPWAASGTAARGFKHHPLIPASLVAANHGQLLEKLKAAPQTEPLKSMMSAIEGLLVTGINPDPSIRLNLTARR
jgi:hypothetical protein